MPARKSDASAAAAARRSDVSAARFVLADDVPEAADTTMTTAPPAASAPPAPTPSAETPTPTSQPAAPGSASPSDKRPKSGGGPVSEKGDKDKEDAVTIEDLALPKSIITRLAKGVLPANTQIQANAILALTKSATVFINHLANAANENTLASNKKTIMPPDVFKALDDIEYGFMKERLELEFAKFNSIQTSKRSTYRKKVAAAKKASGTAGNAEASFMSTATNDAGEEEEEEEAGNDTQVAGRGFAAVNAPKQSTTETGERSAKKAKLDAGVSSKMEVDGQVSDAETVPDEEEEEEEEEEEAEEEEEEEEESGEEEEDEDEDKEGRSGGAETDEALDDDSD
ncbi:putative DNA polymerase epsilon subunit D [Triangularia verruculosa]|uniref:DNA polymerase epsilon subunit D n=1 Tax=Triangularia verruculosa TaxID=2587418 RepID=A0AAN6XNS8_9PEZI|nr:putative DNA polymerase epsilon subunit D [Triangularia verruculosa]